MKKLIVLMAFSCLYFYGISQQTNYNLPPGHKVKDKAFRQENYQEKISQLASANPVLLLERDFLSVIPADEFAEMKTQAPETYQYYMKAKEFYENLSPKVKNTFTLEELWDIYMFDTLLTEQIKAIK